MPSADFFARLDAFDWGSYEATYGPATEVPRLVRQMTSAKGEEREAAFRELWENIWHQGTVYDASTPVALFLVELIDDESQPDRATILLDLQMLAIGGSYNVLDRNLRKGRDRSGDAIAPLDPDTEWNERCHADRNWVGKLVQGIAIGTPSYLRLLKHSDPRMRESAAHVLGSLPISTAIDPNVLWDAAAREADMLARISMILAGSRHSRPIDARERTVAALHLERVDLARFACALAAARASGSEIPAEVLQVLTETASERERPAMLVESRWFHLTHDASMAITDWLAGTTAGAALLQHLLSRFPRLSSDEAANLATVMLDLASPSCDWSVSYRRLSDPQQRVLRALQTREDFWWPRVGGAVPAPAATLQPLRLPIDRVSLERYIEEGTS